MTEADAIKQVAKANAALHELAHQRLKEDKSDGIRCTKWLSHHYQLYQTILHEMHSHGLITDDDLAAAHKLSGDDQP